MAIQLSSLLTTAFATLFAIGGLFLLIQPSRLSRLASLSLAIVILFFASNVPALASTQIAALGSSDQTVTQDESQFKLNPGEGHYSGLEYAPRTGEKQEPVSDSVIKKTIKSQADDSVVVAVANGSVRLSGTIDNKEDARDLISKVKEIPGVHEITFDLGLEE